MPFNIVAIRSGEDVGDDSLYPELSAEGQPHVVALTPEDGKPAVFISSGLSVNTHVSGGGQKLLSVQDVKIEVLVTDSRLIVGCSKYDKGGGWTGLGAGALVAVAANGVSKALAARRRRGKALVGHIRYPWLAAVGGSPRQGWLDTEQLRLLVQRTTTDGGEALSLTLSMDKRLNSLAIAQEIAHRAAAWRLANDNITNPDEASTLRGLTTADLMDAKPKAFSLYTFPGNYPVSTATAFPRRTDESVVPAEPSPSSTENGGSQP